MKYRTVIEVVCEGAGKEDAYTIAGDYLRGDVDFGVTMTSKTDTVFAHNIKKYGLSCAAVLLVFTAFLLKLTPIGSIAVSSSQEKGSQSIVPGTYTVMPALKTKHKVDFRKEWEKKKEEAVMDYLKK